MPTYLITKSDFSDYVDLSNHVNEKYIKRHILTAQERYLRPLLGDAFYAEIIEDVSTGYYGTGIQALIDTYIKPYLVWRSYQVFLPHSRQFFTNMGPRVLIEENSRAINDSELSIVVHEAESNADAYERILVDYLRDNKNDFATWRDAKDKNTSTYLPNITAVGNKSREQLLRRGPQFYDKE